MVNLVNSWVEYSFFFPLVQTYKNRPRKAKNEVARFYGSRCRSLYASTAGLLCSSLLLSAYCCHCGWRCKKASDIVSALAATVRPAVVYWHFPIPSRRGLTRDEIRSRSGSAPDSRTPSWCEWPVVHPPTTSTSNWYDIQRRIKPGFHYPSWRPELTARVDGRPVSITRQHGPCWRVMETGRPSTRAVNSGSKNRA